MYCMKCGKEIPDDSKVCGYCGFKLPVQPAAAPPKEPAKPASPKAAEKPPVKAAKAPAPKKTAKPAKPKPAKGRTFPTWGWIAIGAGVVLVAVVLIFTLGNSATKLVLSGGCQETFYAPADEPLELHYGYWGVIGSDLVEENQSALSIYIYINGTPGVGQSAKPARTSDLPCVEREDYTDEAWNEARWLHAVSTVTLGPGSHHVLIIVSLSDEVSDGFDSDGDGSLDLYGPGELIRQEYTIVAQE
jgi:hypothetical protein